MPRMLISFCDHLIGEFGYIFRDAMAQKGDDELAEREEWSVLGHPPALDDTMMCFGKHG